MPSELGQNHTVAEGYKSPIAANKQEGMMGKDGSCAQRFSVRFSHLSFWTPLLPALVPTQSCFSFPKQANDSFIHTQITETYMTFLLGSFAF